MTVKLLVVISNVSEVSATMDMIRKLDKFCDTEREEDGYVLIESTLQNLKRTCFSFFSNADFTVVGNVSKDLKLFYKGALLVHTPANGPTSFTLDAASLENSPKKAVYWGGFSVCGGSESQNNSLALNNVHTEAINDDDSCSQEFF